MSHVVPSLLLGRISMCGYLQQLKCRTIRINPMQHMVCEPLAFSDMITEVFKSCRNLVLQKGTKWAMWSPFAIGISTCQYLWQMLCQTIGINAKRQDLVASSLSWHDEGSFEESQKPRFAKGGPHEPCGPQFPIVDISCKSSATRQR